MARSTLTVTQNNPVYLVGLGATLPPFRYTNRDLAPYFNCDTATADRYAEATGVYARHSVVDLADGRRQKVLAEDLAYDAAEIALDGANIGPKDIDAVVTAGSMFDYLLPSIGARLLKRFRMSPMPTFDLYGGCAEFLTGVSMAENLVRSGAHDTVLITASETITSFARQMRFPVDAFIFGDAGGAWVITSKPRGGSQPVFEISETFAATSAEYEGEPTEIIVQPIGGFKEDFDGFFQDDTLDPRMAAVSGEANLAGRWSHDARFALRLAPFGMLEAFKQVTQHCTADGGYIVPHQGSRPVLDATQDLLPEGWTLTENIRERGNLSTVCIPMASYEHLDTLAAASDIVCASVGVGFSYAGARLSTVA